VRPGALTILVTDAATGAGIPGATVRIANHAATTREDGQCSFSTIPAGNMAVAVTKSGYFAGRIDAEIVPDVTVARSVSILASIEPTTYDVLIVGAGTGGVSAAIQAARMGVRVALLEDSDWIGGQMTAAAVTSLDEGPALRTIRSGIYREFVDLVTSHYAAVNKSTGTAYFSSRSLAFEPSVGQRLLYALMRETDERFIDGRGTELDLYLSVEVTEVLKEGTVVGGIRLADGTALRSAVVIDASEYGDVLPLAGARYRVGNSTSDAVNLAACTQALTYTAVIRKHLADMDPALQMRTPPPGYEVVAEQYGRSVTNDGHFSTAIPVSFVFHNAYRGMPDSGNPLDYDASPERMGLITKTGVNWFNDHEVTVRYVEDRAQRRAIDCSAKLKTLQFLYYLQHDLGHGAWSVADDENFDTPHNSGNSCSDFPPELKPLERQFPPKPYVREARRAIGMMTLTAADIRREGTPGVAVRRFPSALAVGDYPLDLHGCFQAADLDCGDSASDMATGHGGVFQVPLEVFVPEVVDGLVLAEKNISVSRLVNGATRLQPITMMTGQAAGALAALTAQRGVPPREIRAVDVQWALLEAGSVLSLQNPSDVPPGHPYWKQLQLGLVYGIAGYSGDRFDVDGTVRSYDMAEVITKAFGSSPSVGDPDEPATRADFAIALAQAMHLDLARAPASPAYVDVPPSHPAFRQVQLLHEMGILEEGDAVSTFEPERALTRGAVVFYTVNAALRWETSSLFGRAP
jgi:hypothetical protein